MSGYVGRTPSAGASVLIPALLWHMDAKATQYRRQRRARTRIQINRAMT
jgi:hypothetical protein